MANTIPAALIPVLYASAATVAREQIGFIPAVDQRFNEKNLKVGQTLTIPISPAQTSTAWVPSNVAPSGTNRILTNTDVTITSSESSEFVLTDNDDAMLRDGGNEIGLDTTRQSFQSCFRVLSNKVEAEIAALEIYACRGIGTAGTTPFASGIGDSAKCLKELKRNGAPDDGDFSIVLGLEAAANVRSNTDLVNVNKAGTADTLRYGSLLQLNGFAIRESSQVVDHVSGTANGAYTVNNGNVAVGSTALTVADGAGTMLIGDLLYNTTVGVDSQKYGIRTALNAGAVTIRAPGLVKAWANDQTLAIAANHAANMAIHRSAIILVAGAPVINPTAIMATELVTDPVSGLQFIVCRIEQDGQVTYRVHLSWGTKVMYSDRIIKLIG
jgi:hypothetical protein